MNFFTNITFSGESNTFSLKFARNSISFLILNEPLSSSNKLYRLYVLKTRLCCIEIQVLSILDRDQFLALYLVQRSIFWVSPMQKMLFPYAKDTFRGSLDTEPVSVSPIQTSCIEHNLVCRFALCSSE